MSLLHQVSRGSMLLPSAVDYAARGLGARTVLPRTSARSPGIVTITSAYASRAQRPPPGCGKRMTINMQLRHRLLCGSTVSAHESGHVRTAAFTLADQAPPQHARGISVAETPAAHFVGSVHNDVRPRRQKHMQSIRVDSICRCCIRYPAAVCYCPQRSITLHAASALERGSPTHQRGRLAS
jgi:hypothetical protein